MEKEGNQVLVVLLEGECKINQMIHKNAHMALLLSNEQKHT